MHALKMRQLVLNVSEMRSKDWHRGLAVGLVAGVAAGTVAALHWASRGRMWREWLPAWMFSAAADGEVPANDIEFDSAKLPDRVLRKAEAVIARRTSRFIVVIERCTADHNYSAIMRTAEAMGVQNVWVIQPPKPQVDSTSNHVAHRASKTWDLGC